MRTRATFYEQFPQGLMTPAAKPETGCVDCIADGYCHHHYAEVIREMIFSLWDDMIHLVSLVPCPEGERGYVLRYGFVERLLRSLREETESRQRFTVGNLARVRQVRSA